MPSLPGDALSHALRGRGDVVPVRGDPRRELTDPTTNEDTTMSCNHLVPATKIHAFYSSEHKTLTVSAEVTFGPGNFGIEICRSLLDAPKTPTPAFLISAPPPSGIQPQYIITRTISESFPVDAAPRSVLVYSAGADGPTKSEIAVSDVPPAPVAPPVARAATTPAATPAGAPVPALPIVEEATGWSRTYDYDEAFAAALTSLRAGAGFGNPDVGLRATVVATGVQVGGFTAFHGLFVTLRRS